MRILIGILAITMLLSSAAFAAAPPAKPDTPAQTTQRKSHISVSHEGNDSIGARLSTRLKELFNASNLFSLNEKDAPKIRLAIITQPEFAERPNVGSVYTVAWLFSQSEGHLGYLLARELGTLSADDVDNVAAKLVERSDGIAVKYGYLFQ